MWDWMVGVKYIDDDYNIYDGAHVETNCTDINRAQFSYNNAVFLLGAAYMYNYVSRLLSLSFFFLFFFFLFGSLILAHSRSVPSLDIDEHAV